MAKSLYLFNSIIFSFAVTFGLILFFVYYHIQSTFQPKVFSAKKETVFEISLIEPEPEVKKEEKKIPAPPPPKPKKVEEEPVEKEASKTPKIGTDFKNLFSEVETKTPIKKIPKEIPNKDDAAASRNKSYKTQTKARKSSEATEITEKIAIKQTVAFTVSTGDYDEYYAKIQEFLWSRWNPVNYRPGIQSKVLITIDKEGYFTYRIIKSFGDDALDTDFEAFLDSMRSVQFPPFDKGEKTDIEVLFKAER